MAVAERRDLFGTGDAHTRPPGRSSTGSPTSFADASAPVGLSCRVFRTPDVLRGAPPVEQLVVVLR